MQASPRIAIIGGGPGGLTLARILHVKGLLATVFEAESGPDVRRQGGSLDLHTESGLMALEAAGLMEDFNRVARVEDQGVRLYDKAGRCVFDDNGKPHDGRPEIDRAFLRALLLRSLPEGTVRWGNKVKAIESLTDGAYAVLLEHGVMEQFDLIVGADGVWSRTRSLVSADTPGYTGVAFIEMTIDDADRRHPDLSRLVGRGKIFALAEGKALIAQRNSGGKLHVYATMNHETQCGTSITRDLVLAHYAGWSADLLAFIHAADDGMAARSIYAFPVGYRWDHRTGVTLLGDAAHVMSPFAGEGVNNAMLDAVELAKALGRPDWRAGVRDYEEAMFERVQDSAAQSTESMVAFLAPEGLENALRIFQQHTDSEMQL